MRKIVTVVGLITSYILCFYFGWSVENRENVQLRDALIQSVDSNTERYKLEARHNLNLLFALKEGKLNLVERALIGDLGRVFSYPMFSNKEDMDETTIAINGEAKRFQQLYCSDLCLGVTDE